MGPLKQSLRSNDGLSPDTPWKTIGKVNSEYGNAISEGDDIYFKRGDTFAADPWLYLALGGTSTEEMIVGAYGTGAQPVLNGGGNWVTYPWGPNIEYLTVQDLSLTNSNSGGIYYVDNDNVNNLTLKITFPSIAGDNDIG